MLTTNFGMMDGRELWTDIIDDIPTDPGVYSWYRRLSVDELTPDTFRTTLAERLAADTHLPSFVGKAGPFGVNIGPGTFDLTEAKLGISNRVCKSKQRRSRFAYALLVSSVFQPPMYIGKANDLRGRIKDHRDGKTDFAARIKPYNLMPDELVVAYVHFDEGSMPDKTNELLEYVLSVLATPPFVERRG
jgi:hypothetical protein